MFTDTKPFHIAVTLLGHAFLILIPQIPLLDLDSHTPQRTLGHAMHQSRSLSYWYFWHKSMEAARHNWVALYPERQDPPHIRSALQGHWMTGEQDVQYNPFQTPFPSMHKTRPCQWWCLVHVEEHWTMEWGLMGGNNIRGNHFTLTMMQRPL
jgi:hypothetical protein